jgi:transcriptional regulator with XRE-family HTH domain
MDEKTEDKARDLIKNNLKRLRYERGVSGSTVARLLNIETSHVYRIERGESALSPEYMDKLCKSFKVDHTYFFINHDRPSPQEENQIPTELFNELARVKDLPPEMRRAVVNFIRFQFHLIKTKEAEYLEASLINRDEERISRKLIDRQHNRRGRPPKKIPAVAAEEKTVDNQDHELGDGCL